MPDAQRGWDVAAWQKLPDTLDQRCRQLVVQLRTLKDRSGLGLVSLAGKTGYSRSSWERYLNGKAMPPARAVEELARVAGADPTRLLVLHEVAKEYWRHSAAAPSASPSVSPSASPARGPDAVQDARGPDAAGASGAAPVYGPRGPLAEAMTARPPGIRPSAVLVAVVVAALMGMGAGILIARTWSDDGGTTTVTAGSAASSRAAASATPTTPGPGRYVFEPGKVYPCRVRRTHGPGGGLSAGYSATRTAVLAGPGWDVVEAQCLLRYRGLAPGGVDGVYGQQTIAAVMRLQKQAGLPADGVVGPHTWQVLRG